jgi:hypothetical protein
MRFLKRLLFILLLLLLSFFLYRLINPTWAKALLFDLKSFSNTRLGTHFVLTDEPLTTSWSSLTITWNALSNTWILQETSDDELLFDDIFPPEDDSSTKSQTTWVLNDTLNDTSSTTSSTPCPAMPTVNSCPANQEKYVSYSSSACWEYYACRIKTVTPPSTTVVTPSSTNGLSSQELRDLKNLLKNFQ